jgi:hypothetical protein
MTARQHGWLHRACHRCSSCDSWVPVAKPAVPCKTEGCACHQPGCSGCSPCFSSQGSLQ